MARKWRPVYDGILQIAQLSENDGTICQEDWGDDGSPKEEEVREIVSRSLNWEDCSKLVNVPGQKYIFGNGKDLELIRTVKETGQYLVVKKTDVGTKHFEITVDEYNKFWIKAVDENHVVFVNAKRLNVNSQMRLKFGDVVYASEDSCTEWDPRADGEWKPFKSFTPYREKTVLKFMRQKRKKKQTGDLASSDRDCDITVPLQRTDFLKDSNSQALSPGPTWQTDVILSKIFDCLAVMDDYSNLTDLFNCRLVCKAWNNAVLPVIEEKFEVGIKIVADHLITAPNESPMRLLEFSKRMGRFNFHKWKIDIWPGWGEVPVDERDNSPERKDAMARIAVDYTEFLKGCSSVVKCLHINVDYLPFLSQTLEKFYHSLESLTIQINSHWMTDCLPNNKDCPVKSFPKLKFLQLDFPCFEPQYLVRLTNLSWLKGLLLAASGVEELVLQGYAPVVSTLSNFVKLKKLTVSGCICYCFYRLQLIPCLKVLSTLPTGNLVRLKVNLDGCDDLDPDDFEVASRNKEVQDHLLQFLKLHAQTLENLEIITYPKQSIMLPKRLKALKRLWVTYSTYALNGCLWGTKLSSQVTGKASGFQVDAPLENLTCITYESNFSNGTPSGALVYGKWNLIEGTFTSIIPNVDKIWSWTQSS